MSIASTIAVSGLSVASLRLQVAASNIANASSDGPLPGTPNLENFPPAYRAPFQRRPRAVCRTTPAADRGGCRHKRQAGRRRASAGPALQSPCRKTWRRRSWRCSGPPADRRARPGRRSEIPATICGAKWPAGVPDFWSWRIESEFRCPAVPPASAPGTPLR